MRLVSAKLLNEYNAAQKGRGCWPSDRPGSRKTTRIGHRPEEEPRSTLESVCIHRLKPSPSTPTQNMENSNHAD